MYKVLTIGLISNLNSPVVCDVFSLGLFPFNVESCLLDEVVAVLVDNALGTPEVLFFCCLFPPVPQIPIFIVKST